jgi:hypothetical protein
LFVVSAGEPANLIADVAIPDQAGRHQGPRGAVRCLIGYFSLCTKIVCNSIDYCFDISRYKKKYRPSEGRTIYNSLDVKWLAPNPDFLAATGTASDDSYWFDLTTARLLCTIYVHALE